MNKHRDFLPISRADMLQRGWYYYDFLVITGDAYVDHPSFGTAIISRVPVSYTHLTLPTKLEV